ncbi:adenine deaminase C-terminal domain-containing protein [Veillonella rogosae]|nr:adenine deaminase C-terminal domain-containing protein [Veillonella rogosae]
MMVAIERIREIGGGGYVITSEGKVVEELALEVMGGLITN